MRLIDFVVPEAIIPDMKARTKDEAIQEIVETLAAVGIVEPFDVPNVMRSVHRREDLGSTGIGRGIAQPEVSARRMRLPCVAIFFARDGIDWDSLDEQNVDLIIASIKDPDFPDECLDLEDLLSEALRNKKFRDQLRQAKTREEVLAVIEGETYDIYPSSPEELWPDQEKPPE